MEFDNVCRGLNFEESYFVPLNCFVSTFNDKLQ